MLVGCGGDGWMGAPATTQVSPQTAEPEATPTAPAATAQTAPATDTAPPPTPTAAETGPPVFRPGDDTITLTAGPQFVIELPEPEEGAEWRLFSRPDDMGGVSLKGMANVNGGGRWTFDTIGAGSGTLEFQQIPSGGQEPTETTTFEVTVS